VLYSLQEDEQLRRAIEESLKTAELEQARHDMRQSQAAALEGAGTLTAQQQQQQQQQQGLSREGYRCTGSSRACQMPWRRMRLQQQCSSP